MQLAPLDPTASELIMLRNKQLIPTIAYRLLASLLFISQVYTPQQSIWYCLSKYGKLPRLLRPKDRHVSLGPTPLQTFPQSQIHNYSLRYINDEGPPQSNFFVRQALTAARRNRLQVAFVDATTALGGRCHGFSPQKR